MLASSAAASEFKILHVFKGADGANPLGGLIFDAAGNLYGTTAGGGSSSTECTSPGLNGCGIVFKLAPNPDGTWTESVLHTFSGADGDGIAPRSRADLRRGWQSLRHNLPGWRLQPQRDWLRHRVQARAQLGRDLDGERAPHL